MPKVTEYPNITSISASNIILYVVDISGSAPVSGKISGSNLETSISGSGTASLESSVGSKLYLYSNFI